MFEIEATGVSVELCRQCVILRSKKMASVHVTIILCEPYTAQLRKALFTDLRTFLCIFMSVVKVFLRKELCVNVQVAIFFTEAREALWSTILHREEMSLLLAVFTLFLIH